MDIAVSGATGRMGRSLGRILRESEDLHAIGGIAPDRPVEGAEAIGFPTLVDPEEAGELIRRADAVIDFSAPQQLAVLLDRHADALAGRALLVGTTGLVAEIHEALDNLARHGPVLVAANFSVGVNLLLGLVEQAARALPAEDYDIEVVETHHRAKEDAPSGTAEALARAAARARGEELGRVRKDGRRGRPGPRPPGEIGLHALRGGGVAGEHIVHLLGDGERISLGHAAGSRDLFAHGALRAARWLVGREAGHYTMQQVLGLG